MKYLVTGAAGFIGSNLVDALLHDGGEVLAIDNESATTHEKFYWNDKAENYKLDICEYRDIRKLFNGVDFVFHLAAESRIQLAINDPLSSIKTNVLGTANVLQCSAEAGVKRVVYSSTSSAYGSNALPHIETQQPICLNPYSVSKLAGENLCSVYYKIYGLETIVLRYFNVYGDREPTLGNYAPVVGLFKRQRSLGMPMTIVGNGEQRRDFTNVRDVVRANMLAINAEIDAELLGTVFNVGTGKNYSINEIVSMLGGDRLYIDDRPGEADATLADNNKAKKYLGWFPEVDFEQYLKS